MHNVLMDILLSGVRVDHGNQVHNGNVTFAKNLKLSIFRVGCVANVTSMFALFAVLKMVVDSQILRITCHHGVWTQRGIAMVNINARSVNPFSFAPLVDGAARYVSIMCVQRAGLQ